MADFFKGIDLVYVVGILSALIGGAWAFYRVVYEKKLTKFNEANKDLFSDNKQMILTSIATLGVYKKDWMFEKNTIDVLISKLYTETDYDITNAIGNALIQYSNRRELYYIANEILDINRNFFIQSFPYGQMVGDLERYESNYINQNSQFFRVAQYKLDEEARTTIQNEIKLKYKELKQKQEYQLTWLNQITADTFGRIIRRAYNLKLSPRSILSEYIMRCFVDWNFKIYSKKVDFRLFQNTFSQVQLSDFKTKKCEMVLSTLSLASMIDIEFNNITRIYRTSFSSAIITNCIFSNGDISHCDILKTNFTNVNFINVRFTDVFFNYSVFQNCSFVNCTGLKPENFFKATFSGRNVLPDNISMEMITNLSAESLIRKVAESDIINSNKYSYILDVLSDAENASAIRNIVKENPESLKRIIYESEMSFNNKNTYWENLLKFSNQNVEISNKDNVKPETENKEWH